MIVGDLGSVILSQAFNITVNSARLPFGTDTTSLMSFCSSVAFTDDASSGDHRLNLHDLVSIEPIGEIRSSDTDIHSIDSLLSLLLYLRKHAESPLHINEFCGHSCRQWLNYGSIHRWLSSMRIKWSIGDGLDYLLVYPSCPSRSPVKRKMMSAVKRPLGYCLDGSSVWVRNSLNSISNDSRAILQEVLMSREGKTVYFWHPIRNDLGFFRLFE